MLNLGKVSPGSTLYIPFASYGKTNGESITLTGLAVGDIKIYKDGSITERASTSGYALLDTDGIDFDALTGIHGVSIDLADNTTADFYASGSKYWVVISSVTVDSQVVSFIAAVFSIGEVGSILDTTIATLASQTSFTLTNGPADNQALRGCTCVVHDAASAIQQCRGVVSDYVGSTKTVTLKYDPAVFTMAAKDNISFFPELDMKPMTGNGTAMFLDATSGIAQADLAKVGGDTQAQLNLANSLLAMLSGTVQTAEAAANTATVFDTNLALENANYYGNSDGGLVIAFVSTANNKYQTRRIVASVTGTANTRVTVEEAFDGTPADGDTFVVLGRITELT